MLQPKLIAVTDINKDGKPEYWGTKPYIWDTGLKVWEKVGNKMHVLLEVCPGCSD